MTGWALNPGSFRMEHGAADANRQDHAKRTKGTASKLSGSSMEPWPTNAYFGVFYKANTKFSMPTTRPTVMSAFPGSDQASESIHIQHNAIAGSGPCQGLDPARTCEILKRLGFQLTSRASILDLGCGAGHTVYALRDAGYANAVGYDIKDYVELRDPGDRSMFVIGTPLTTTLPFEDGSFDVVISEQVLEHVMDQVGFLRELHRILRAGGYSLHALPARYCLIEPHMLIPFGGFFAHRWWYKLWALLGVRNPFQTGLCADETTDRNIVFFVGSLRYIPNSFYRVVWKRLGFEWQWTDQEHFDTSPRPAIRVLGRLNRVIPTLAWLNQTFRGRRVCLKKPA